MDVKERMDIINPNSNLDAPISVIYKGKIGFMVNIAMKKAEENPVRRYNSLETDCVLFPIFQILLID